MGGGGSGKGGNDMFGMGIHLFFYFNKLFILLNYFYELYLIELS